MLSLASSGIAKLWNKFLTAAVKSWREEHDSGPSPPRPCYLKPTQTQIESELPRGERRQRAVWQGHGEPHPAHSYQASRKLYFPYSYSSLKLSYRILEEQCNNYIPQIHLQTQILSPESTRCAAAWWAAGRSWLLPKVQGWETSSLHSHRAALIQTPAPVQLALPTWAASPASQ